MATITTTGSGNWSSTTPDAPWPSGTKPTTGDVVEIAAGHTVTLDEDTAVLGADGIKNVAGSTTSVLDVSGTRTINGCVSYSGTATSGFVTVGTGDALTINYGGGAGTTAVTNSSTGYAIVQSGSGTTTITNLGGTAVKCSGNGRGVSTVGTGAISITGTVTSTSGGYGVWVESASTSNVFNGSITNTNYAGSWYHKDGTLTWTPSGTGVTLTADGEVGMRIAGGIVNLTAVLVTSVTSTRESSRTIAVAGGTLNYFGTFELPANAECEIVLRSGTLNLVEQADDYTPLVLTNNGSLLIKKTGGTLNTTGNGGASVASIINAVVPSATGGAYAVILGGTYAQKGIITGPTLPAAGDVDSTAADYGYANTLIEPTCVLPAEADVKATVQYGADGTEFTGSLAAGGGGVMNHPGMSGGCNG